MGRFRAYAGAGGHVRPLLLACALVIAAFPAAKAQDPLFRSDVRLVNLLVTVRDADGRLVGGLDKEDFTVLDEGLPREIAVFERRTDRPLSVAVLVDASLSTAIELEYERTSAQRFFANFFGVGSHPNDRVAVFKFSEGVELLAEFTRSQRTLERALGRVKPENGTSLYDAVLLASEELEEREGRRVIAVITDGGDTTSYSGFDIALEAAHAADAVIFGIVVQPIRSDAGRNVGGENALRAMADNTGGQVFLPAGQEELDRTFDRILESLRTQYLLAYYPPPHDDPKTRFRRVQVQVTEPEAEVSARAGYYVPEERRLLPESVSPAAPVETPKPPRRWRKAP